MSDEVWMVTVMDRQQTGLGGTQLALLSDRAKNAPRVRKLFNLSVSGDVSKLIQLEKKQLPVWEDIASQCGASSVL